VKIDFVSNLPLEEESGGWSAISRNIFLQLEKRFDCAFVGPINPDPGILEKTVSKALRLLVRQGQFFFFSESRLAEIADEYDDQKTDAQYTLFHGATPWIRCRPDGPYGAYIDAIFPDYMRIYSTPEQFSVKDLLRISQLEKDWLLKADHVFFGSEWARQAAIREYGLDSQHCDVVWVGGNADIPERDTFSEGYRFLFIALDFERKGGRLCVEAISRVNKEFGQVKLTIVGAPPPEDCLKNPCVEYSGFLRKTEPGEKQEFQALLSDARALVHPTSMDTMGMVLIEAGYYGCPSITSKNFGIPELVLEDRTGYLLPVPPDVDSLASAMIKVCESEDEYLKIRERVRADCTQRLSWDAMGERFSNRINSQVMQ